ncbi:MAG: hypothetical protein IPM79_13620 [Polyangiaceae bacterium]|nr:hypothetical protein [Polyangiaceae bacterium]
MPTNQKTGYGLSGLSILLLVMFALPWTSVSCAGREIFTQTGYQVIVGDATSPMAEAGKKDPAVDEQSKKNEDGSMAAWWLLLVPLGALAAGFAGFRHARGAMSAAKLGAGASGVAALTLSLALAIGLPIESKVQEAKEEMTKEQKKADAGPEDPFADMGKEMGKAMGDLIVVKRENNPWYALVVTWAMLGVSIVMLRTSGPPKLE